MKFGLDIPTRLMFGAGELNKLSTVMLPGTKALLVHHAGDAWHRLGYSERVVRLLSLAGVETAVFDYDNRNTEQSHLEQGKALCRARECDFVVALGGRTAIDAAKVIADNTLPLITIPTTAAAGTRLPRVLPVMCIVDPDLMMSVPSRVLALHGFDAFCHAAEGYISRAHNPISDLYALEAVRLLYKYLPVAVVDCNNHWARVKLSWASTLAGMVANTSSATGEHALTDAMCERFPSMRHGTALVGIAPAYFKALKNDVMKRLMKMAEKMTQQKAARPGDFLDALDVMTRECRLDGINLRDCGVSEADIEPMVAAAVVAGESLLDNDPRFLNREELYDIYLKALG